MCNYSTHDYPPIRWAAVALLSLMSAWTAAAVPTDPYRPPDADSVQTVVEELVAEALAANLELDGAASGVTQRLAALEQARARYLPALDFSARYSRADGGRTLELPVGDLLNPVYRSLDQLTGSKAFAPIPNAQIDFQRRREQETGLSLTQALYDARLGAARAIALADYDAASAARGALADRVARDTREAYYRWLQATARVEIFDAARVLAEENLRVNESLLRNGKITPDLVFRADADRLEIEQSLLGARNAVRLAQSYVNLLRNAPFERPLRTAVVHVPDIDRVHADAATLETLERRALERRPELRQLEALTAAADAAVRLARAAFKPQLALAIDAGTQGVGYGFSSEDRFVLASVVLKFSLFAGGADQAGLAGARAARHAVDVDRERQTQQIRLEVQQALQNLEFDQASLQTAAKRIEAAQGAFRIAARKRDLGQINQVDFIDARRLLTDAELNLNLIRFASLSDIADCEYALGIPAMTSETYP